MLRVLGLWSVTENHGMQKIKVHTLTLALSVSVDNLIKVGEVALVKMKMKKHCKSSSQLREKDLSHCSSTASVCASVTCQQ